MWPLLASVVTACVVVVVRNLVVHAFLKKKDDGGSDVNNNETDFENNAAAVAEGAPMRVAEGMTLLVKRQDDTLRDLEAEMQHTKFEFQTALRRTAPDQSQFTSLEEFKDINQENQMLAPHLLRRVKKDVMKKLPPRKELISFVELSRKQKEHYKEPLICNYQLLTPRGDSQMHVINGVMELAKLYCHSFILEGVEPEYTNNYQLVTRRGGAQIPLINVVMELAKLCCYPFMLEGVELEDTNEFYKQLLDTLAGKLQLLDKTIVKPREQGHRVLIYTQLQHMLDYYFNCRIDGKVSGGKRQVGINRVGDLGLSKVKHQTLTLGGVLGTRLCMANELLNGSGSSSHVSEKVDLFSFGTVIWELLAGVIIRNTLRPLVPESCDLKWRSLMERCWSADPSERPSFTDVANQLRTITSKVPPKVTRGTTEEGIMEMTKKKMVLPPSPLPPSTPSPLPPTTSSSIRYSPHPPSPQPSSTTTTSIHHSPHPLKSTAGSRLRLYPQMKPIKREIQAPCTPKFQPSVTSSIRYSTNPPSPPSPPPPTTTTTSVLHSPHSPKSSATLRLRHYPRMKPIEREVQAPCIIIRGFNDIYKNRAPCTSNIQPSTTSSIWQSPHPPKSSATFRLLDKSRTDKKIGFKSRTDRIRIV